MTTKAVTKKITVRNNDSRSVKFSLTHAPTLAQHFVADATAQVLHVWRCGQPYLVVTAANKDLSVWSHGPANPKYFCFANSRFGFWHCPELMSLCIAKFSCRQCNSMQALVVAAATVKFDRASVSVPAKSSASFSVTIILPKNLAGASGGSSLAAVAILGSTFRSCMQIAFGASCWDACHLPGSHTRG